MKNKKAKFCDQCGQLLPENRQEKGLDPNPYIEPEPIVLFKKKNVADKPEEQPIAETDGEESSVLDNQDFYVINKNDPDLVKKEKERLNEEKKMEQKRLARQEPEEHQSEVINVNGKNVRVQNTGSSMTVETPDGFGGKPDMDALQERLTQKLDSKGKGYTVVDSEGNKTEVHGSDVGTVEKNPDAPQSTNIPIEVGQTLDNIDFEKA